MTHSHTSHPLFQPLDLPCGVQLKNRIVKSAMSDSLGDGQGNPSDVQAQLYQMWAEGGVGLSLIGEVQVTAACPEKPGNLVLTADADLEAMAHLARRGAAQGAHIWPQLGHAGALAHPPIATPLGPSALELEGVRCAELTTTQIKALPEQYAQAAKLAQQVGFGGVLIHAAHGFLLSQFLSPLFNHRADRYGGSIANRFRIIADIIAAVRARVGPAFPIGIKINATDALEGGLSGHDALAVVEMLDATSIDLIDISGGTYFPGAPASSESKASDGPYFADFAKRARKATSVPIVLTGGITTQAQAVAVIEDGIADFVGLARALVVTPDLPRVWQSGASADPVFPRFDAPPPGGITAWYTMRMTALAEARAASFDMSPQDALDAYLARDAARCALWRAKFG